MHECMCTKKGVFYEMAVSVNMYLVYLCSGLNEQEVLM